MEYLVNSLERLLHCGNRAVLLGGDLRRTFVAVVALAQDVYRVGSQFFQTYAQGLRPRVGRLTFLQHLHGYLVKQFAADELRHAAPMAVIGQYLTPGDLASPGKKVTAWLELVIVGPEHRADFLVDFFGILDPLHLATNVGPEPALADMELSKKLGGFF